MLKGSGATAKKINETEDAIIYEYGGYDLDEARVENPEQHFEGTITINKSSLDALNQGATSPTSESRLKQIPQLLSAGAIDIFTNGKHEDPQDGNVNPVASWILTGLFFHLDENGELTDSITLIS